jgi:hypothetical protein
VVGLGCILLYVSQDGSLVNLVSLARAVYSRASILLLDDVLSAGMFYDHLLCTILIYVGSGCSYRSSSLSRMLERRAHAR